MAAELPSRCDPSAGGNEEGLPLSPGLPPAYLRRHLRRGRLIILFWIGQTRLEERRHHKTRPKVQPAEASVIDAALGEQYPVVNCKARQERSSSTDQAVANGGDLQVR